MNQTVGPDPGGGSASGYCNRPASQPFPILPTRISPFDHSGEEPETVRVRMFVTGPIPRQHLECFDRLSPPECLDVEPPLEPLPSTEVSFGVSLYEYWAPAVAEVSGQSVAALASADGVDHVLGQVLTPAPGEQGFTTTLPATGGDRLVAVLDTTTGKFDECLGAAASYEEELACFPVLELRIGERTVLLERGEFGDIPELGGTHGFFRVPAGEQRIDLRVNRGDPENAEFALVLFEEDS